MDDPTAASTRIERRGEAKPSEASWTSLAARHFDLLEVENRACRAWRRSPWSVGQEGKGASLGRGRPPARPQRPDRLRAKAGARGREGPRPGRTWRRTGGGAAPTRPRTA